MSSNIEQNLSRRERQIMNILFRRDRASVIEIAAELPKAPSHTAVRTLLRILETKGHVRREKDGRRHLYRPKVSRTRAARAALTQVLGTFFDGSLGAAVAAHLADPSTELDPEELSHLRKLIDTAKEDE